MKHIHYYIIGVAMMGSVLLSCSGSDKKTGTAFNPEERTSSLSTEERDQRLAQKRAELGGDLDSLMHSHGVKFSILQPKVGGDITNDVADRLSMKMLEIASQNGISGLGTNPGFVLGAEIAQTGRAATGTAPQKMTVKYDLTFKVMNATTGDVYGTAKQEVQGVGNSFEEASQNAVKDIKNTPQLQKMLQTASDRIVSWYNESVQVLKNQVQQAETDGNFALALALLSSVPEQAKTAFAWASQKQPETLKAMLHKHAADMLGEMEAILASSGDEFNPAVGAYFSMIPTDCPEHGTAQKLYAEYEKKCNARRAALEAKAERDEQAARELEKLQMLYDHEEQIARYEVDKVEAKYQAQAAAAQANSKPRGFFGSLGYAITGVADRVFKVADTMGSAFSKELNLGD